MKFKKSIFLLVILFTIILPFSKTFSQKNNTQPKFGLTASLQDNQLDILIPIWINDKINISPGVSFIYIEDYKKDYSICLIPHFYLNRNKVSPYIGARAGVLISSPKFNNSTTDYILGLCSGGEYFIDEHFSFGVEAQLNASISDKNSNRFGNPGGMTINTGMAIFGTIYF